MIESNIDQIFPLLSRRALCERARVWAADEKYNGHVVKITLHEYISGKWNNFRYASIFHLKSKHSGCNSEVSDKEKKEIDHYVIMSTAPIAKAASFRAVYKDNNPLEGYQCEWFFYPVWEDENIPTYLSAASWQLYPQETDQAEPDSPTIDRKTFVKMGQKGGCKSKIKKPILQAIILFLKEKKSRLKDPVAKVCKDFKYSHTEAKQMDVSSIDYDVYYNQGRIYCKAFMNGKTVDDSISLNTFKKTYIPRAKKEINLLDVGPTK
jgi:hypothetical protein